MSHLSPVFTAVISYVPTTSAVWGCHLFFFCRFGYEFGKPALWVPPFQESKGGMKLMNPKMLR